MTAVSVFVLQTSVLFLKSRDRKHLNLNHLLCLSLVSLLCPCVADDRVATLKFSENGNNFPSGGSLHNVKGTFAGYSDAKKAEGNIVQLPLSECGDQDEVWLSSVAAKSSEHWVGLLSYPYRDENNDTMFNGTECQGVLDRVKRAMVFGASAIIILVLNPKIVKEIDMGQLFAKPVVLIQTADNVTAILNALISKLRLRVKISRESTPDQPQTYTVWSTCWRAKPGSGVVCGFQNTLGKADPGYFWNYFFSALATIILLLVLKANVAGDQDDQPEQVQECVRRIALQALGVMRVKRYKPKHKDFDDSQRDTCAICLELYKPKQKLRILPCKHEFHAACVDPWLIKCQTCPLCKLNVIDKQILAGVQ